MTNLYSHRDANIRKTWLIFSVFLCAVIGIGWVFSQIYGNSSILAFAVLFSSAMSIISYWFSDKIVLATAGARPIEKNDAPELFNIVENLAITAGIPMPRIYVVPDPSPNAFATGRDAKHAVIAVTSGLVSLLNRTELEGVIAHELSHIGNRDMLVSTVAVILVGFISLIADFFVRSLWFGRMGRHDDDNRAGGMLVIVGIVLSIIAPIAASLMQLAISRKREFLADASGALLTRYPEGLASALEKISRIKVPVAHATPTTAHLWFSDPLKRKMGVMRLFMSHPPVEERIKALRGMQNI